MIRIKTDFLSTAIASAFGIVAIAPVDRAEASCPHCAREWTQLLNNAQLAAQYARQLQQHADQLRKYQEMLRQGEKLNVFQWTDAASSLRELSLVVQQGRALAYSTRDLGSAFRDRFQDYEREEVMFDTLLDDWAETSMDSIKGAMLAANMQADKLRSEEQVLARMRTLSSSVDGKLEAISVGNQIAVEQAVQMQKLRQLMMAQMQAQNVYLASEQAKEEELRKRTKEFFPAPTLEGIRAQQRTASYHGEQLIMRYLIAMVLVAMFAGCTSDEAPLTAAERGDMAAMEELVRKCNANPPKNETQAYWNCVTARQITFFKPPTLESIRAAQRAATSAGAAQRAATSAGQEQQR